MGLANGARLGQDPINVLEKLLAVNSPLQCLAAHALRHNLRPVVFLSGGLDRHDAYGRALDEQIRFAPEVAYCGVTAFCPYGARR